MYPDKLYEQRTKFAVWPMVKIPILVLQSRSISLDILRSMWGGLRPTDQIYSYFVLQHLGPALNLDFQQICIETQKKLISFLGRTISSYRLNA